MDLTDQGRQGQSQNTFFVYNCYTLENVKLFQRYTFFCNGGIDLLLLTYNDLKEEKYF